MVKKQKLYRLRAGISIKSERVKFLLENIIEKLVGNTESQVLAEIALDEINRISRMSEKIGIILKH
ncbi:MAG: hypothetical protein A2Y25_11060 [Candidatus Melainabacteria bacterium GWF2_37_15]|nr:MAG: hypothetical protein A2Y25_11060 [Candidatus Melainabacteria bacterium GWF2_37_15]